MFVNNFLMNGNPFFDAYLESDTLGKMIFIGLVLLSVISWILIIYKYWEIWQARNNSKVITNTFRTQKGNPLHVELPNIKGVNPFETLYAVLKKYALDLLNKNQNNSLNKTDIDFVEAQLDTTIANQTKYLDKNLFILSTVVSLGPFLGLLGTVWGILTTFSELQMANGATTNQTVLSGLSLALATTVLGLLCAIPALIGYNYLKNGVRDFEVEMESFSTEILTAVELQYRK